MTIKEMKLQMAATTAVCCQRMQFQHANMKIGADPEKSWQMQTMAKTNVLFMDHARVGKLEQPFFP